MGLFSFLRPKTIEQKESEARKVATYYQIGQPQTTPVNYNNLAKQGYVGNPLVHACIKKISQSCAGIELQAFKKRAGGRPMEVRDGEILDLMNKPNPMQSGSSFIESVVGFYLLTGNTYIEGYEALGSITELWPVRPDRMRIIPGKNGLPKAYEYKYGGSIKSWDVDPIKLTSLIMHSKTFNPTDDWYGMSPLQAAMLSLDQDNAASKWNLSMLQNMATPSGVLSVKVTDANPRGAIADEAFNQIQEEFEMKHTGAHNAGRPLVLEGGLEWQSISLSPREMDYLNSKRLTQDDIMMVYGVPSEILGIGAKTFSNYREARLSFYEETILPLMDNILGELNRWLAPYFGDIYLAYNPDNIEALTYRREQKFNTVSGINFLTQNEKREMVGYEPKPNWDVFIINNQPVSDPSEMIGAPVDDLMRDREEDDEEEEDEDNNLDAESDEGEDIEEGEKGWKTFNLLNDREKRQSWRRQNTRKNSLANAFERDMALDFNDLNEKLINASLRIQDPKLLEFEVANIIQKSTTEFEKTLNHHIGRTATEFGETVLNEGKSLFTNIETKANRHFESFVQSYTATRTGEAIKTIVSTTQKRIREIVGDITLETILEGETLENFTDKLTSKLNVESRARARVIARTEVQLATNNASREAVRSMEIPNMTKEWVSAVDDRTRDSHIDMNGTKTELDDVFTTPTGVNMDGPGDPGAPPEEIINCRCALVYKSNNPVR